MENKWIAVKDRLPDNGQEVIAWSREDGYENCLFDAKNHLWARPGNNAYWEVGHATHWMPLPKPPEGF